MYPDHLDDDLRDEIRWNLHEEIESLVGNTVQVFAVSTSRLAEMTVADDPLVESWRRDARLLSGPPLDLVVLPVAAA